MVPAEAEAGLQSSWTSRPPDWHKQNRLRMAGAVRKCRRTCARPERSEKCNVFWRESIFTACLSKQTDKSSFHLTESVHAASGNAGMLLHFKQTSGRQQIQVFFSSSVLKTTYLSMWTWNDSKALKWEKSRKESIPFGPHPSVNKDLTKHCFALEPET